MSKRWVCFRSCRALEHRLRRPVSGIVRRVISKNSDSTAYQWSNALFTAGRAIPAEVFPAALAEWKVAPSERSSTWQVDAVQREIDKFLETIQTRQSFFAEVAAST